MANCKLLNAFKSMSIISCTTKF